MLLLLVATMATVSSVVETAVAAAAISASGAPDSDRLGPASEDERRRICTPDPARSSADMAGGEAMSAMAGFFFAVLLLRFLPPADDELEVTEEADDEDF
jgi:hypothetical protein